MEFFSPASKQVRAGGGRVDSGHGNNYGSPLRRKHLIQRAPLNVGIRSLTFLSPKPSVVNDSGGEFKTQNVSNIINVQPMLEEGLAVFDYNVLSSDYKIRSQQQLAKSNDSEIAKSEFSLTNRINKRRNFDNEWVDNVPTAFNTLSCFDQCSRKRRKIESLVTKPIHKIEQLEETYRSIDWWQDKMNHLLSKDWNYKRKYWIDQCHNALWNVLTNKALLEKPGSEMFPNVLSPISQLTEADKHWINVLINSARIEKIKCPEFAELTHDPQSKSKGEEDEFEFQIQFHFGFDIRDLEWYIHCGIGSRGVTRSICRIIAEYVGRSKLFCDVQIYYKGSAPLWWEQDGIAMIKYYNKGKYIDMVDFSPESESYFIPQWPENYLVVDDYCDLDASEFEEFEDETPHMLMERRFVAAVCCQIMHICICKTPAPQSCAARNILKQISMILKGWFIGVLLGGSLSPEKLKFEYDTRAPCLAPVMNAHRT